MMLDPRTIPEMTAGRIREVLREMGGEIPGDILKTLRNDRRATVRKLAEAPQPVKQRVPDRDMLVIERDLREQGFELIAGVDEAGRGPLAGPVVAAAVILPPDCSLPGLTDSKKLTAKHRELLVPQIHEAALSVGVQMIDAETIDTINILQATLRAMRESIGQLDPQPDHVIIDGTILSRSPFPETAVVKGDAKSLSIAAASVIAKVTRDTFMKEMDEKYPGYGFAKHKGYATQQHLAALREQGPSPIHRRSFFGVVESDADASPGYANMSRGIRMAETVEELEAVGKAISEHVNEMTEEEVAALRKHYKRQLTQLRRRAE